MVTDKGEVGCLDKHQYQLNSSHMCIQHGAQTSEIILHDDHPFPITLEMALCIYESEKA
jgi:hypothetical protein